MLLNDCCCEPSCTIDIDTFDRLNSNDIGGQWSDTNSKIQDGRLTQQALGSSSAVTVRQHTTERMSVDVSVGFTSFSISTDAALVCVNYLDSNNYLYVQIETTPTSSPSTSLKFFRRSGGVSTQLGSTRTIDASNRVLNTQVRVCYDGTYLHALGYLEAAAPIVGGFKVGLLTNATTAVYFDDFRWYRYAANCPRCTIFASCSRCPQLPSYLVFDLGAGGLSAGFCSGCANIAGEYVLRSTLNPCYWRYDGTVCISGSCTLAFNIVGELLRQATGDLYWQVVVLIPQNPVCSSDFLSVIYQSSAFTEDNCTDTPVTLNRGSTFGSVCAGSLPATAELRLI